MQLCFATYVYGWYQDFVPIYIFSILHEFPQHYVKIYLQNNLTNNNKKAISILSEYHSGFEIIENYSGVNCENITHLPSIRYLLPRSEFKDFKYVYIGDVDFIVLNEHNDDFVSYYKSHCNKTKLPFSNAITHDNNKNRMTGLHFIETDPYYDKIEPEISKVIMGTEFSKKIRNSFSFDEEILYDMINHVYNLAPLEGYIRPHNGVHFGYARERPTGHSYAGKTKLKDWRKHFNKSDKIIKHQVFADLYQCLGSSAKTIIDRVLTILYRPMFL